MTIELDDGAAKLCEKLVYCATVVGLRGSTDGNGQDTD